MSEAFRIEHDIIGEMHIPQDVYYGIHSVRAAENFPITGQRLQRDMIVSIAWIKKACARANLAAGTIREDVSRAIEQACDEIIAGRLHDQFIVDPIQGGAGTSTNMNANEVIANRAIEILGGKKGDYTLVNPNDDVNCGQSTNDVYPSCGKMTLHTFALRLLPELQRLIDAMDDKAREFDAVVKMGRTQLQDAVPIRLGQEFRAYSQAVRRDIARFERAKGEMRCLNMGGTAIGTGINADVQYLKRIVPNLSKVSGLNLVQACDLIDATQNLDEFVAVSGVVKTCAVNLSKMSNDLRLMSSGPRCGLHEINLPPRQNGSSIMPGKVNPVIPEVVNQVAFNIMGNDLTITLAAEAGQLELNAFEPIIFWNLTHAVEFLTYAVRTLVDHCVVGITANRERCRQMVEHSVGIVTALCPHIGYEKAAEIAKQAMESGQSVRSVVLSQGLLGEAALDKILDLYAMTEPGISEKELLEE